MKLFTPDVYVELCAATADDEDNLKALTGTIGVRGGLATKSSGLKSLVPPTSNFIHPSLSQRRARNMSGDSASASVSKHGRAPSTGGGNDFWSEIGGMLKEEKEGEDEDAVGEL